MYYTYAYTSLQNNSSTNQRAIWYQKNKKFIYFSQSFFLIGSLFLILFIFFNYTINFSAISKSEFFYLFIFPIVAFLYYGIENKYIKNINLRNIGWLKPITIGFVWSGAVTIYPILFYTLIHQKQFHITMDITLLFAINLFFITALCIMFDIKDYATDSNLSLKTFVVKIGLRKTIYNILVPIIFIGILLQVYYGFYKKMELHNILLNILPFLFATIISFSLQKRKSILFYLIVIDGIMIIKGLCGILSS